MTSSASSSVSSPKILVRKASIATETYFVPNIVVSRKSKFPFFEYRLIIDQSSFIIQMLLKFEPINSN